MPDTVAAAIISVSGAVLVAIVSVITQLFVTKSVIHAEREKLLTQLQGEESSRTKEKRRDRIIDAISELLAKSDPQIAPGVDYGRVVSLIHRVQLLLNLSRSNEFALNAALNQLVLQVQEYVFVQNKPIDDKVLETKSLLNAQAAVSDITRTIVSGG
jgi:hypothetical protein